MNDPSVWGGLILPQTLLFMDTGTYPTGVTFFSQAHLKWSAVKRKRKGGRGKPEDRVMFKYTFYG